MKFLKNTWQFILGLVTAIIGGVLLFNKNDEADKLQRKFDGEIEPIQDSLKELEEKAKGIEVGMNKKVEVKDLNEKEVTDYWKNKIDEE